MLYNAICPKCGSHKACKDWAYIGGKGYEIDIYCHECGAISEDKGGIKYGDKRNNKAGIRAYDIAQ